MRRALFSFIGVSLLVLGSACSSEEEDEHTEHMAQASACADEHRKDVYVEGMSKAAGDALTVKIVGAMADFPKKGMNDLTLEITDAAGAPVDDATVTVRPYMPDHAHGTSVVPEVTPSGDGRYAVSKIYMMMAGLWQVTVSVQTAGGGPLNEAVFLFCIDG